MCIVMLMLCRREDLIEDPFEHFAAAMADPVVALVRADGFEGGDEDAEVLDGL